MSDLLIESDRFPFEWLSKLAERESWRKEIYRPVHHIHKWWAKRLGSVFRGILLACHVPPTANLSDVFYREHSLSHTRVLDPFMGSGITLGEAHKLGCIAFGQDINPVACESVRISLGPLNRTNLLENFDKLSEQVENKLRALYKTQDEQGRECDVLYYFWIQQATCIHCKREFDLFPTQVIARNAYPDKKPEVQVCCPRCGTLFRSKTRDELAICPCCAHQFNPSVGNVKGAKAQCLHCGETMHVVSAFQTSQKPPEYRLYAKLILKSDGSKKYLASTSEDVESYQQASRQLKDELDRGTVRIPNTHLASGYNTRQAINYNFRSWRNFFNDRQLLGLGLLNAAIQTIKDTSARDAFSQLFSGVLEFNNMFASYKGEGTGAVRHMFANHVLKPERMPIEANIWGTPKSSGAFSGLFRTRLLRAADYQQSPYEVGINGKGKIRLPKVKFGHQVAVGFWSESNDNEHKVFIECGSSHKLNLPDQSIDFVVTDPPFFDNVHYSELADFFFAWQRLYPHVFVGEAHSTRNPFEVQDTEPEKFAEKLSSALRECHRVLTQRGLLIFTYHHSKLKGWHAVYQAIRSAGFSIVQAHPVKAEMSVAIPKSQAKEPIQIDIILVCKKLEEDTRHAPRVSEAVTSATSLAAKKAARLINAGFRLSRNDLKVIAVSQLLCCLGPRDNIAIDDEVQAAMGAIHLDDFEIEAAHSPIASANNDLPLQPPLDLKIP